MKKFAFICMMAAVAAIGLTACSGAGTENQDEAIAKKIENKEQLDQKDYSRMIEYVGQYAEKAQPLIDNQINGDAAKATSEDLNKLKEEYPLMETFRNCIKSTALADFDAENQKLMQKYAGLIEFSVPEGFEIQTDPQAAGMEMDAVQTQDGTVVTDMVQDTVKQEGF